MNDDFDFEQYNIFRQLGFADWQERTQKANLAIAISGILRDGQVSWPDAAAAAGVSEDDLQAMTRGRTDRYSVAEREAMKAGIEAINPAMDNRR
jgi:hypothetical protein